jgi:hypothetical protein
VKTMPALGTSGPIKAASCIVGNSRTGPVGVRVPRFRYQYLHLLLRHQKRKAEGGIVSARFTAVDSNSCAGAVSGTTRLWL